MEPFHQSKKTANRIRKPALGSSPSNRHQEPAHHLGKASGCLQFCKLNHLSHCFLHRWNRLRGLCPYPTANAFRTKLLLRCWKPYSDCRQRLVISEANASCARAAVLKHSYRCHGLSSMSRSYSKYSLTSFMPLRAGHVTTADPYAFRTSYIASALSPK